MNTWILSLMLILAKAEAPSKYVPTYETTATAIATAAEEAPLPLGVDAARKTAAILASWAWNESRFDPHAVGDHGTSFCLMQINNSNFRDLGIANGEELTSDPVKCMRAGLKMLATSYRVCAGRPMGERGAWYILGGGSCANGPAVVYERSRYRLTKGKKLYETVPFTPDDEPLSLR